MTTEGTPSNAAPTTATPTNTAAPTNGQPANTAPTNTTPGATVGDLAQQNANGNSASASVPFGTGGGAADVDAFRQALGDLADNPSLKNITDVKGLAEQFINAQALIGQKLGIPDDKSTPEARAAFNKAMGVPDTADGYGFEMPKDLPEALQKTYDPEDAKKWAAKMHELGVPLKQANELRNAFIAQAVEQFKGMSDDISKSDAQFDEMATKTFGDKKGQAIEWANAQISKYLPKELAADLQQNGTNSMLVAIAAVAQGVARELGGEDKDLFNGGSNAPVKTANELRQEAMKLQSLPEYNDPFVKGKDAHEELKTKVRDLYRQIDTINNSGRR